jgi:hypothetical protein
MYLKEIVYESKFKKVVVTVSSPVDLTFCTRLECGGIGVAMGFENFILRVPGDSETYRLVVGWEFFLVNLHQHKRFSLSIMNDSTLIFRLNGQEEVIENIIDKHFSELHYVFHSIQSSVSLQVPSIAPVNPLSPENYFYGSSIIRYAVSPQASPTN